MTLQVREQATLGSKARCLLVRLPLVVVREFLDKFPLGTAGSNGWVDWIDRHAILTGSGIPSIFLNWHSSRPNASATRHQVLDIRTDTSVTDLLALVNKVEVNATVDCHRHFLRVPKHLSSLITDIVAKLRYS